MSTFVVVNPILGNPTPVSLTGTVKLFPLGYTADCEDRQSGASSLNQGAGRFVYAQGSNVTAIGQFVHLQNQSAVLLASANSTNGFQVGVAAGNLSATNVFGWVQVAGRCDYARGTNSSIAAGQPLYLAGTSGLLISGSAAGSRVDGILCPVSYTSSQSASMTVELNGAAFIRGVTASQ